MLVRHVVGVIALTLTLPALTAAQPPVVDLGTLGGTFSNAWAVNASGQVVGESRLVGDTVTHPFSWTSDGGMVDLGTFGGTYGSASAVNGNGQVIGWSLVAGDVTSHAFSWTPGGQVLDLGTLGGTFSSARGLNASGQVVGTSGLADGSVHAFSWTEAGGLVDLGTLGGVFSTASAVNNAGLVVGGSVRADDAFHAFAWTSSGGMIDLGTLGGTFSTAVAVNGQGQVVGTSSLDGDLVQHAFLWTAAGGMIDLGTLGGSASFVDAGPPTPSSSLINASGQVVGGSALPGDNEQHSFSWTATGGMVDLGTLGSSFSFVAAVNDNGQVVGSSYPGPSFPPLRAFSWTAAGGMVDLGTLGGTNSSATALNARGQVVGSSDIAGDAATHATMWHTQSDSPSELLSALIERVTALSLRPGPGRSLLAPLLAASKRLENVNGSGNAATLGALQAFVNQLLALPVLVTVDGQTVPESEKSALVEDAQQIIDLIFG